MSLEPDRQLLGDWHRRPGLEDWVVDNLCKFSITESESLLIGRNFGIGTDIQPRPNSNLLLISRSNGAMYEMFRSH